MYGVGPSPQSIVKKLKGLPSRSILLLLLAIALPFTPHLEAQTGGEAGIQGTVTDTTGAVIPNAGVTVTNTATGVTTKTQTTGSGLYTVSPILPGIYTVTAKAEGFGTVTQQNLVVNALKLTALNLTLATGTSTQEVTVSAAPPPLETTNATLGSTLENSTYSNLPLQMSGQQRDPTAFATLTPGTQSGARAPIIGGTGNYLAAVYVDGIPVTTINQQGDNRVVANALPVESIDQFQVVTSSPDAEYQGAGLINFTLKSGGDKYHGSLNAYVRARAFDAWSYASKNATTVRSDGSIGPPTKPDEHQNELVASAGGPIPFTRKRGFVWFTYDRYHGRNGVNPNFLTIPTAKMRQGDFSELLSNNPKVPNVHIYDPTTNGSCRDAVVANKATTICRQAFPGNVIPSSYLSPITLKMQSFLPTNYANPGTINNFFGGVPSGYDNWEIAGRADYDLTSRQRISYVLAYGVRKNVPYTVGGNPAGVVLPEPYTSGAHATITPIVTDVEHAWQISDHITNQLKFGFNRFGQPQGNLTENVSPYRATDLGITGLPDGQAANEFPGTSFSGTTASPTVITSWIGSSNASGGSTASAQPTTSTVPNTYTLLDNLLWTKGSHAITFGFTTQWLQDNVAAQIGPSGIYQLNFTANSTAAIVGGTVSPNAALPADAVGAQGIGGTGFSYASYLLGAASQSTVALQAVSEVGGRYHDISPYVADVWRVTSKLTLNLGLRWDYFSPYHEVQDRWSFLNPNIQNPLTGNMGALQFAGNHGGPGVSCNCRTPVQTYWKNFGPRVSFAYSVTPTTVIRGGYGLLYSLGGGVGGRNGAGTGTGQIGFNTNAVTPNENTNTTQGAIGPSYYLNNSAYFQGAGLANTSFGGPGYTLPALPQQNTTAQGLLTSYYGATGSSGSGPAYADPYLSGRAPEFNLWNFGIQQALTNNLTLTLNYAGTSSHFLVTGGSNIRGYWANQLDPRYLVALANVPDSTGTVSVLGQPANPANVAIVSRALAGYKLPYPAISGPSAKASIAQTLVAFPQYNGLNDIWGQSVGNANYHSLQASLSQRLTNGLSFTANYTWSKNLGDDGTFRSGFDLPPGSVSRTSRGFKQNQIERSLTTTDMTHNISIYGVWELPFGRGKIGNDHLMARALAGGWQISSIYQFASGTPFVPTYSGCTTPSIAGTCQLDLNPNFSGNPHVNGGYRKFNTQYINPEAFIAPENFGNNFATNLTKIGNAPRTAPYGLRNPYYWNDDISLRRAFNLGTERMKFIAEVDCLNVANHATMSNPSTGWASGSSSFGVITGARANPRDFQFAGHFTF
jgi:hypothetical protein